MTTTIANTTRPRIHAAAICAAMLSAWPFALHAQELSYDGNRWFEVELSIFTNEYPASQYSEQPVAENLSLQYFPKLQKLLTPIGSLMIDFPEPELPDAFPQQVPANPGQQGIDQPEQPAVEMGPLHSPALPGAYKVSDYARDPFITLAARAARFNSINRDLAGSSEHRILWHEVWRQPIQPRAQTPALVVYGGDIRGTHAELEGSLRLSDLGGKPTLDINVWLNSFSDVPQSAEAEPAEAEWKVPQLPLPLEEVEAAPPDAAPLLPVEEPAITAVWQLQQTRDLSAELLYYLDHPAFGVIVQLRPYLLPEQPVVTDEGDF